ncbi:MAG: YezD family protein [Blautia sp.]|nr:YezD family protein [Blautia sp.]
MSKLNHLEEKPPISEEQMQKILEMAKTLQYGTITLVFQQGQLIQLDRSEKVRV